MDKTKRDKLTASGKGTATPHLRTRIIPSDVIGANAQKNPVTMLHYREGREGDQALPIEILGNSCNLATRRCYDTYRRIKSPRDKRIMNRTARLLRRHYPQCNSKDMDGVMTLLPVGPSYKYRPSGPQNATSIANLPPRNPSSSLPATPSPMHDTPLGSQI